MNSYELGLSTLVQKPRMNLAGEATCGGGIILMTMVLPALAGLGVGLFVPPLAGFVIGAGLAVTDVAVYEYKRRNPPPPPALPAPGTPIPPAKPSIIPEWVDVNTILFASGGMTLATALRLLLKR